MLFALKKLIGFWLMPLPFCLALMTVGTLAAYATRYRRLGRFGVGMGLLLLLVFSNKGVSRWLIRPLEARYPAMPEQVAASGSPAELATCRFIVVLGGGNGFSPGMAPNHLLSSGSLARIVEGARLLHQLPSAKLVVSGPAIRSGETHATVLARTARGLGVPSERIIYIDQARDTEEEAAATHRVVGDAPVALVTSAWHMPRAVALFRDAGVRVLPCPTDYMTHVGDGWTASDLLCDVNALERSTLAVRERIGFLWIWLRGKV